MERRGEGKGGGGVTRSPIREKTRILSIVLPFGPVLCHGSLLLEHGYVGVKGGGGGGDLFTD